MQLLIEIWSRNKPILASPPFNCCFARASIAYSVNFQCTSGRVSEWVWVGGWHPQIMQVNRYMSLKIRDVCDNFYYQTYHVEISCRRDIA